MSEFSPHDMALRGRMGGLTTRATNDPKDYTAKAREAVHGDGKNPGAYWMSLVDPAGVLPEVERAARARAARTLHFVKAGRASALARRKVAR